VRRPGFVKPSVQGQREALEASLWARPESVGHPVEQDLTNQGVHHGFLAPPR